MSRLRVFTWHVHGNYLWYLSHLPHDVYVPVRPGRPPGYAGRSASFPWPDNVHEVPATEVADLELDAVLFQSHRNWEVDQHVVLTERQRALPRIFLEHDPPRASPTDTPHPVDDPEVLLVHVTHFNDLMWDSGGTPTRVIEHGVAVPDGVRWTGEIDRAVVVVNGLARRGRRLGRDVFERVRAEAPLDLVGMESADLGGLGEVPPPELPAFIARYRCFFNPIRYTSLGLAVCEAMAVGLPVVGLATTEMTTVVRNGETGFVATDVAEATQRLRQVLADRSLAERLGQAARAEARRRFGMGRFVADWDAALQAVVAGRAVAGALR